MGNAVFKDGNYYLDDCILSEESYVNFVQEYARRIPDYALDMKPSPEYAINLIKHQGRNNIDCSFICNEYLDGETYPVTRIECKIFYNGSEINRKELDYDNGVHDIDLVVVEYIVR